MVEQQVSLLEQVAAAVAPQGQEVMVKTGVTETQPLSDKKQAAAVAVPAVVALRQAATVELTEALAEMDHLAQEAAPAE
jgi:hypothetical protein